MLFLFNKVCIVSASFSSRVSNPLLRGLYTLITPPLASKFCKIFFSSSLRPLLEGINKTLTSFRLLISTNLGRYPLSSNLL